MASGDSDPETEYALSKLLQMGTVAEYHIEFEMLIKRVTISESLLKSFYISGLKLDLQCLLLRSNPKTLDEAFSLTRAAETRFANLDIWEFLRSNPLTFGEAFFKARITEARFEDKRSTTAIVKTNDLNTRVQVQDLEETTRHKPNKVKAIKTSGSILLVESKYYATNQVGSIFNKSNEAIYYERILDLIAGQLCQYLCKHVLGFDYDPQEAILQLKTWDPGIKIFF
ncbi:hypothetical protein Tco_1260534 [Tanacetum coccineum]